MTIRLNVADTLRAAAKAKEEGRLAAFRDDVTQCEYRYKGNPGVVCAVGAGMSDAQIKKLGRDRMGASIRHLIDGDIVKVQGDPAILIELQQRHDNATRSFDNQGQKRASFTRYLNRQIAKLDAAA